jgi:hypothetical protein
VNYDPGTHNFERDNREALYKVIGQHWYAGDTRFSLNEIECAGEVKTAEQLAVDLPADNLDLQKLAANLMERLPAKQPSRAEVAAILRLPKENNLAAVKGEKAYAGPLTIQRWKLRIGDAWTVPAVELAPALAKGTTLILADGGRSSSSEAVADALAQGRRVVAIDPFYLGESKIEKRDFLFALLVSSVGERPLGVQASQLQSIARWLKADREAGDVQIAAIGPRTSLMALAAAASDEKSIDGLSLTGSLGSLKEVIEQGGQVDQTPEQFCFGLLSTADIEQLAILVAPRPVKFVQPSDRVKTELAGLKQVYAEHGQTFDPLAP